MNARTDGGRDTRTDAQHFSPNLGLKLFTSNIKAWICSSHNTSSVHWHHYCDCRTLAAHGLEELVFSCAVVSVFGSGEKYDLVYILLLMYLEYNTAVVLC